MHFCIFIKSVFSVFLETLIILTFIIMYQLTVNFIDEPALTCSKCDYTHCLSVLNAAYDLFADIVGFSIEFIS